MWLSGVFILLAATAAAEPARLHWRPFALDKRNVTTSLPTEYITPSTTTSTTPITSISSSSGSSTSTNPSSTKDSVIASVPLSTGHRFTYSPDTSSTISTSSSFTSSSRPYGTAPPAIVPIGTAPNRNHDSTSSGGVLPTNSSSFLGTGTEVPQAICSGATLNVLSASLDWWYTQTYTYIATTFVVQFDTNDVQTGWSAVPATTSFDVASALANPSCSDVTTYDSTYSETVVDQVCISTPAPVAAATSVVSQVAYRTINDTTGTGTQLPDVVITPAPAAVTIANSGGNFSAGTPFVFFSRYEIMSKRPTTYGNGSVGCAETTSVYNMSNPFSFEYAGGDVNGSLEVNAGVTGDVAPAFLGVVNVTNAIAGSWVAEPTVAVVVIQTVAAQAVLAAHTEISASSLDTPTPTPTLPSGISLISTQPTQPGTYTLYSPRIESSETALDVPTAASQVNSAETGGSDTSTDTDTGDDAPYTRQRTFVAHIESHGTTLILATPTDGEYITTTVDGEQITATAIGAVTPAGVSQNSPSPGANVGGIVSAVLSAVAPTKSPNPLEILSQALLSSASAGNPLASAIVAGIGGGIAQLPASSATSGPTEQGNSNTGGNAGNKQANPVLTISGSAVTGSLVGGQTPSAIVIAGQTATAGGQAITVAGQQVSLAPGATAVIVGSSTLNLAAATTPGAAANIPLITLGSQTYTANAATQYNIGGSVLTPGGSVVVSGTTLSLAAGATAAVVNGQTQSLSPPLVTLPAALTVGGTVYQANSGSTYFIGGQSLTPGGVVTVSGTTVSLAKSASAVVINGQTQTLSPGSVVINGQTQALPPPVVTPGPSAQSDNRATITAPAVLTVNGQPIAPNAGTTYVISGQILTPGGAITISAPGGLETISLHPAANQLVTVQNGHTGTSFIGSVVGAARSGAPVLTVDGTTYSAVSYNAGSGATYVINGQTLTPGGTITVSGPHGLETISLQPGGTAIVDVQAGKTTTSTIPGAYGVHPTAPPVLTIGSETFTAINNGATYVIDGQTLTPGEIETITLSGQVYILSLSPAATILEIEFVGSNGRITSTSFETLFPATATGSTVYNTVLTGGATSRSTTASVRATATPSTTGSPGAELASSAPRIFVSVLLAFGSLALAVWL